MWRRSGGAFIAGAVFAAILFCAANDALAQVRADNTNVVRITDDGFFKQRPSFSPDGRYVVFARHQGADISLYLRELNGGKEERLTSRKDPEYDAQFSRDGKSLVFAFDKTSPNQGDLEVYRIGLAERKPHPLAVTGAQLSHEESPCWSPDGKQIAFTSTREGNQELFVVDSGGGDWKRLTSDPAIDAHPAWSPDGKTIAFATNRWGDLEIALVNPDGTNLRQLTESPGLDDYPAWSPDGKSIAFTSNRDGNLEIYVASPDGKSPVNVTHHPAIDNFPAWTHDGRIGFVSNRGGGFEIFVTEASRALADR